MKITYNWLKDFVEIKIPARALAEKLTMAGLEVTALEEQGGDFVFEIEITSNRPDWLSVVGIAREVAAITGEKIKETKIQILKQKLQESLNIKIEDKKDCSLYTGKIIRNVNVGASPKWLKERLELIGCRSVNNIVDITNYVLFETGEPLHAFDSDKLAGKAIIVRRAKKDEKIITIDATERTLDPDVLVIADEAKPVAIAGIMGGKDSEVSFNTKNILLEAAIFNPVITRRSRQKLALQTDSSYRFERGIDAQTVQNASWRAVQLIQELASGEFMVTKAAGLAAIKKKTIRLNAAVVSKILGVVIPATKIKNILTHLGFKVQAKGKNAFAVIVPSYRQDINLEVDLIEEISRIFGYSHIPVSLPAVSPEINPNITRELVSLSKNALVGLGVNEVITYSLIDRDWLKDFSFSSLHPVEVLNPLSKEQEILRPSLIPSLARTVAFNLNQKQNYVNIFEVAKVFSVDKNAYPKEELTLGIALCGEKATLLSRGLIREEMGLLHLKGIIEILLRHLGIQKYNFQADNRGVVIEKNGVNLGFLTQLPKQALNSLDIKNKEVFVAEIYLEKVFSAANLTKKFSALPVYPGISRDISLLLKEEIKIADISQLIQEKGQPLLREVRVVDFYKGKQIPAGHKGLTISCLYRSDERTLTEEEINPLHALVLAGLQEKFNAQTR